MVACKVRRTRATYVVIAFALTAGAAQAEGSGGWLGFYRPSVTQAPAAAAPVNASVCMTEILQAQARYNIPDNLLLAIGIQEAGRRVDGKIAIWPWTANARGKGVFFDSKQDLEAWVRQTQASGTRSVDVGCMQINQKWHARQFASLEEATDPKSNVDYAARFLLSLYRETRDWWQAAGRYHSSTESYKSVYLRKLGKNQKLANRHQVHFAKQNAPTQATAVTAAPWYAPAVNWTSDMTGSQGVSRNVMSIYSASPLQAVLPDYEQAD